MAYELWDVAIGRMLGAFAEKDRALREVCALLDYYGEMHVANLVLTGDDGCEGLAGADLATQAQAVAPGYSD